MSSNPNLRNLEKKKSTAFSKLRTIFGPSSGEDSGSGGGGGRGKRPSVRDDYCVVTPADGVVQVGADACLLWQCAVAIGVAVPMIEIKTPTKTALYQFIDCCKI